MQLAALDLPESERQRWAYHFERDEQPNIYLTNTLEKQTRLNTNREEHISEYSRGGASLRADINTLHIAPTNQMLIVLGNPPFAGHSSNKGQWITTLIDTYKEGCPELKKPGQAKWLSDDYVKFMRFAQWHIEQAGLWHSGLHH